MVDKVFQVLSSLVKKNLVKEVTVPDIRAEITALRETKEVYERAGFEALATSESHQSLLLLREEIEKKAQLRWRERGYLVITLPAFEKGHQRHPMYSTTMKNNHFNNQLREVLAIIDVSGYKGHVPMSVVETLVDFKEEFDAGNGNFKILTYGVLNDIKNDVVGIQDPLLLYKIGSGFRGGGTFAVVAWWGADIEDIERALSWVHSGYPNLAVFPPEKK